MIETDCSCENRMVL